MASAAQRRTVTRTVLAQDPSVRRDGRIVRAQVEIPAEALQPGPRGYRVHVVDYDASTDTLYKPRETDLDADPYADADDAVLLADPWFHGQNVYALVMRTLARFEFALGRRISWGFRGHQVQVAPHAFAEANAFYSESDHALLFGYFPPRKGDGMVYTCLSHDVVVHETAHALLDGLRDHYTDPSSPDQAAFHEGFADVVALLSVFSLPGVAAKVIDRASAEREEPDLIAADDLTATSLSQSVLLGLAKEVGQEIAAVRGRPLRRSVELEPSPAYYHDQAEFREPHRRGEILVAAMMHAFLAVWLKRMGDLGELRPGFKSRARVIEEGAEIADCLLTVAIRALDYAPVVDIQFGDYLSALLTADRELVHHDAKYDLRTFLRQTFATYGIKPAARNEADDGTWSAPEAECSYRGVHFESLQRDPDEVFRFVWENRDLLGVHPGAYSRVVSVRPCIRIGPDGFLLHETVAEFRQILELRADELEARGIEKPPDMPPGRRVRLCGGNVLIFDEYGRLKFNVHKRLISSEQQSHRLAHLWRSGALRKPGRARRPFADLHRRRAMDEPAWHQEEW